MRLRVVLITLLVVAGAIYLLNASWLAASQNGTPVFLAHRGVHQTYHRDNLKSDTCTATRIDKPAHPYLENTLASMDAAFTAGADIVEFDIHPTTDGHFAVFHDWTLDCRTEGSGVTRQKSLAELKQLDIGYGYTADGGKTFPFRGKGKGLMPSLDEVLERFPDRRFLINIKSNDPEEGKLLATRLSRLPDDQLKRLMAYGGDRPISELRERLPEMVVMSKRSLMACGLRYLALGWSNHVPKSCARNILLVPSNIAPWIWGWPDRLTARMERVGTAVFVVGSMDGTDGATGIDTPEQARSVPQRRNLGVWTNRIEALGLPAAAPRERPELP
jgi:glycerophosphoryl diester phosphodiesterase